jgi:hypothetical protein
MNQGGRKVHKFVVGVHKAIFRNGSPDKAEIISSTFGFLYFGYDGADRTPASSHEQKTLNTA